MFLICRAIILNVKSENNISVGLGLCPDNEACRYLGELATSLQGMQVFSTWFNTLLRQMSQQELDLGLVYKEGILV